MQLDSNLNEFAPFLSSVSKRFQPQRLEPDGQQPVNLGRKKKKEKGGLLAASPLAAWLPPMPITRLRGDLGGCLDSGAEEGRTLAEEWSRPSPAQTQQ